MRAKLALIALLGVLGGCAHLTNNDQALCAHQPLCSYHADYGYRFMPEKRSQKDDKYADETLVVVTMSGGGMKAAALAYGTLLALKAMPARNGDPNRSFLSDVDLISSVSGGSVTAGWYALHGAAGIGGDNALQNFIMKGATGEIAWRAANPDSLARYAFTPYQRSDALAEEFGDRLYGRTTTFNDVEDLYKKDKDQAFVILNATDIGHETRFTFTQSHFDLICSDLRRYPLEYGVASSANFPLAFSAIGVHNFSGPGCPVVEALRGQEGPGRWVRDVLRNATTTLQGSPTSTRATVAGQEDLLARSNNLLAIRAAREAAGYLCVADTESTFCKRLGINTSEGDGPELHLLDGGLVDNLGIHSALMLEDVSDHPPGLWSRVVERNEAYCRIKRVLFIVVNARSRDNAEMNTSVYPPSMLSTMWYLTNTSLDSTILTTQNYLTAELQALNFRRTRASLCGTAPPAPRTAAALTPAEQIDMKIVSVDFDMIINAPCRQKFASIQASWGLKKNEAEALESLPAYLLRRSPELEEYIRSVHGDSQAWRSRLDGENACSLMDATPN